ncbi:MAG: carboxypeptidase-like regulatory domain-containing protein [Planctomycetota bacterium]
MCFRTIVIAAVFSVSVLSGCGSSKTGSVTGKVTLDGQPVSEASIAFRPKDGGRMSTGETNAQGEYTLTCYERGDGAIPGDHVVTVTKFEESKVKVPEGADELAVEFAASKKRQPKTKWLVPEKYSEKETSGLTFTVERGRNTADFDLKSE